MARIYLASSWRNEHQPPAVQQFRAAGHDVYDFREPRPGEEGFSWSSIDPDWKSWTTEKYLAGLAHPLAQKGYNRDFAAMLWADVFVLLLPCGRSAHLEAGWAVGAGKRLVVVHPDGEEPELMARMADSIVATVDQAAVVISNLEVLTLSDRCQRALTHHVKPHLPEKARVTLLARNHDSTGAHLMVTNDDTEKVLRTVVAAAMKVDLDPLEVMKWWLAKFRAKHGRDALRKKPQGKLLDALDAGMEHSHPDDLPQ